MTETEGEKRGGCGRGAIVLAIIGGLLVVVVGVGTLFLFGLRSTGLRSFQSGSSGSTWHGYSFTPEEQLVMRERFRSEAFSRRVLEGWEVEGVELEEAMDLSQSLVVGADQFNWTLSGDRGLMNGLPQAAQVEISIFALESGVESRTESARAYLESTAYMLPESYKDDLLWSMETRGADLKVLELVRQILDGR